MISNKPLGILAQQNTTSLDITIQNSQPFDRSSLWRLGQISSASMQRFWWHGKGYGTIFGIMLLTLASMIFLGFHWSYRKPLLGFTLGKDTVESTSD
ncbi:hypothetical protein BV372_19800 [Nostoc sp. T09]|nr:hypothetical protein BV372_19800 [Nostoc sp. T09]